MELFEVASRKKYRFPFRGMISVEDLWDLNMTQLDSIYKVLSKSVKTEKEEESLLTAKKCDEDLENMVEIVKRVFKVKKDEAEAAKNAREKAQKKERLLEILAKKQDESLNAKSEEELLKMIDELE